jgi:hypothetical protein
MAIGNTMRDFGNLPMGCALTPGDTIPQPIRGGKEYTDSQNNITTNIAISPEDGWKPTFSATVTANAAYATPTDLLVLPGSATAGKVVKLVRFDIASVATAAGIYTVHLIKRTTGNTGGTSAAMTITKLDSNDTATAAPVTYSVVPTTLGTGTDITAVRLFQNTLTLQPERLSFLFGNGPMEALTLRGVAQAFAVNFNAVALPAGSLFDMTIYWTEE